MNSPFGSLVIGEPDANIEQYQARKREDEPNFIKYHFGFPSFPWEKFKSGELYYILGQKGAGKTAVLRKLEVEMATDGFDTELLVFKETLQEEADLLDFDSPLSQERARETKHYFHLLKRIILLIVSGRIQSLSGASEVEGGLLARVVGQKAATIVEEAFESVADLVAAANVNADALKKNTRF